MEKLFELNPMYVSTMPNIIEHGEIYISKEYEIAIHNCACGCGVKTVTPLGINEWALTENDGLITLRPSIGNFKGENPYHASIGAGRSGYRRKLQTLSVI